VNGTVTDISCHGEDDGAIAVTTTGLTSPIVALWSSGHSTINLSGVVAGNYTVNLTDATGCSLSKTFTITEPDPLTTNAGINTLPDCGASNGILEVYSSNGGTGAYTYNWSNGDIGTTADNIAYGIYSLTTLDGNNCTYVNTFYVSESGAPFLAGSVTGTDCGAATGAINVTPQLSTGVTVTSVSWSNSETTEDIANLAPDLYVCELHTSDNCAAIKAWTVPTPEPERQDICVVTVDSATTTNLVVWEKVQATGVHHYNIYRETSVQGMFALIDTVEYTNLSVFNDVVASPLVRAWRYRIAAVNACGQESEYSTVHQTIHLDVLENGANTADITWNAYEGADFSEYIVSRYTDATGLWEVIATVPNTQLDYTDNVAFTTPGLDYMVEMELDEMCTATIWRAQDFNSSRSNKDKGQFSAGNGTGDSNNGIDESYLQEVKISPNPTNGLLHIAQPEAKALTIEIRSIDGQLLQSVGTSLMNEQIDLGTYANGVYFVTIALQKSREVYRVVKQ
jgi:L-rhamnose mutarotase